MHIPIKVDYGVRALVDLASHEDDGPIIAADISKRMAIPEQFLAQVLHSLGRGGMVKSVRGPRGGHSLAVDAGDIRLSMVMAYLGSGETPVSCLGTDNVCVHMPACAQREVWKSVADAVYKILDSTTIADLVERTKTLREVHRIDSAQVLDVVTI